jgi:hypothetical protein
MPVVLLKLPGKRKERPSLFPKLRNSQIFYLVFKKTHNHKYDQPKEVNRRNENANSLSFSFSEDTSPTRRNTSWQAICDSDRAEFPIKEDYHESLNTVATYARPGEPAPQHGRYV